MIFNSIEFLIFIVIDLSIYYLLPQKYKNVFLLISSYIFYLYSGISNLIILFCYSLFAYFFGVLIEKCSNRKLALSTALFLYFGLLIYFKYLGFFTEIVNNISSLNITLQTIIVPAGISFYTFQIISYLIDVYRSKITAEKKYVSLFLYISFFPKLLVGPIENSEKILKQINEPKDINWNNFYSGIVFALWGYFIKLCIADRIGVYVDTVYGNYLQYQGFYILIAVVLYSFQIYSDFLGYTYIALGIARMMGFELTDNFKSPYLATSINDFWKRWHITLTSWFREYLYIPLGGNRKGKIRTYINKLIVFVVSGLWHGASMGFVMWGLLNGLYVTMEQLLSPLQEKVENKLKINKESNIYKTIAVFRMFILVTFAWIFFRASSINEAINIIKSMFAVNNISILFNGAILNKDLGLGAKNTLLLIPLISILLVVDYFKKKDISISSIILKQNILIKSLILASICLFILLFGKYGLSINMSSFIYAKF